MHVDLQKKKRKKRGKVGKPEEEEREELAKNARQRRRAGRRVSRENPRVCLFTFRKHPADRYNGRISDTLQHGGAVAPLLFKLHGAVVARRKMGL